jgi:hypothetical protein
MGRLFLASSASKFRVTNISFIKKTSLPDTFFLKGFLLGLFIGSIISVSQREKILQRIEDDHNIEKREWHDGYGWKNIQVFYGDADHLFSLYPGNHGSAQVKQDEIVAKLLAGKTNGFFVDLAANDAVILSNTVMLEKSYGWNGGKFVFSKLSTKFNMNFLQK